MNTKYEKYINYIVNDIKTPYFKNMVDMYGLSPDEYEMVLSKVFNQPVNIQGVYNDNYVYDNQYHKLYQESSNGFWVRYEYDNQGYMNTGNQMSFTTPLGHATSTSNIGTVGKGKTSN